MSKEEHVAPKRKGYAKVFAAKMRKLKAEELERLEILHSAPWRQGSPEDDEEEEDEATASKASNWAGPRSTTREEGQAAKKARTAEGWTKTGERCLFFAKAGWCKYGDDCKYEHSELSKPEATSSKAGPTTLDTGERAWAGPSTGKGKAARGDTRKKDARQARSFPKQNWVWVPDEPEVQRKQAKGSVNTRGKQIVYCDSADRKQATQSEKLKEPLVERTIEKVQDKGRAKGCEGEERAQELQPQEPIPAPASNDDAKAESKTDTSQRSSSSSDTDDDKAIEPEEKEESAASPPAFVPDWEGDEET
jgi:hypothetical protein